MGERLLQRALRVTVYCHAPLFEQKPNKVNGINLVYVPRVRTKSLGSQLTIPCSALIHVCFSKFGVWYLYLNSANGPSGILTKKSLVKPSAINVDGLEWLRPKMERFRCHAITSFCPSRRQTHNFMISSSTDSDEIEKIYAWKSSIALQR